MGQAELPPRRYTPEEYFALEERSQVRHEYFEGEVFAMAGASVIHNLIKGSFIASLRPAVRQRGYRYIAENVRLDVQKNSFYTYPDVMVCSPVDRRDAYT